MIHHPLSIAPRRPKSSPLRSSNCATNSDRVATTGRLSPVTYDREGIVMNDIVKRALGSTALTTDLADRLLAGIEESQATTLVVGGGKDLIKLDKGTGLWNIGQADEPMQVGSKWLINILSICHGYICWSNYPGSRKNERLGEVMVPMSEPKPPKPAPIEGFNFAEQRSFEAVCLNGEDEGKEVMFKN